MAAVAEKRERSQDDADALRAELHSYSTRTLKAMLQYAHGRLPFA